MRIEDVIVPDWPAPAGVKAFITTRAGGVSAGAYSSLNLGLHVGDDVEAVRENRRRVATFLPAEPLWLNQVHGTHVIKIDRDFQQTPAAADAATTMLHARPCAVMVADCLPILLCDVDGSCVAAAHAGWRGLAAGVIESTLRAMLESTKIQPSKVMAYLGPAIGPTAFEVGQDVVDAFESSASNAAFQSIPDKPGKYLANVFQLARQRLATAGITRVYGGDHCTVTEPDRFFSFRRDGVTGRMAAIIWRE